MKYHTVIFDLDGTLLNTLDDLHASVNFALAKNGFALRSKEEIRGFLGNGIRNLVQRSMPESASEPETDAVFEAFKAHYSIHLEDRTKPYEGIMELLQYLKEHQVQMAIVSNKADKAVKELVRKYFRGFIETAIGEREGVRKKPEPDSVVEAMRILCAERESAIYVGDSEVDFATAANAGLDCALVTWGFRQEDFLKSLKPKYLIHAPGELTGLLDGE